jgi:adenosyl cobinamide kinase/adenosyl cobinamide phosphate guanylyltransferase
MLRLLIVGARSGKSSVAVRLATAQSGPVIFIATAEPGGANRIWAERAAETFLVVAGRLVPTLDPAALTLD